MTRDEAFAKLSQGHELDEECKRIIAGEFSGRIDQGRVLLSE